MPIRRTKSAATNPVLHDVVSKSGRLPPATAIYLVGVGTDGKVSIGFAIGKDTTDEELDELKRTINQHVPGLVVSAQKG